MWILVMLTPLSRMLRGHQLLGNQMGGTSPALQCMRAMGRKHLVDQRCVRWGEVVDINVWGWRAVRVGVKLSGLCLK